MTFLKDLNLYLLNIIQNLFTSIDNYSFIWVLKKSLFSNILNISINKCNIKKSAFFIFFKNNIFYFKLFSLL